MKPLALAAVALLAACSQQPVPSNTVTSEDSPQVEAVPPSEDASLVPPGNGAAVPDNGSEGPINAADERAYLGRWVGVEGMYLIVSRKAGGGVTLENQWDLDHKGAFDGSVTAEGLRFVREGEAQTAVLSDGKATGLKYLAGKTRCLTVKPGEGYCRQ